MAKMRAVQVPRPKGPLELVEREIPDSGPGRRESRMSGKARFRVVLTTGN